MSSEAIAAVVAAIITALGTIIAAKFSDMVDLLRTPPRKIAGEWEGESWQLERGPVDDADYEQPRPSDIRFVVTLKQKGSKVRGTMTMTEAEPGIGLYKHVYKGYVKGGYFVYDCHTTRPEQFRLSTAMLHVHNSGKLMRGYYIANAGDKSQKRTLLGYAVMRRRE